MMLKKGEKSDKEMIDAVATTNSTARAHGTFSGDLATETKIGAPGSPVAGPQYLANTSTGGTFYHGSDFPTAYHGSYFHADFGQRWIKNIVFDGNHRPCKCATSPRTCAPSFSPRIRPMAGSTTWI
jgi:hypothetical protein